MVLVSGAQALVLMMWLTGPLLRFVLISVATMFLLILVSKWFLLMMSMCVYLVVRVVTVLRPSGIS